MAIHGLVVVGAAVVVGGLDLSDGGLATVGSTTTTKLANNAQSSAPAKTHRPLRHSECSTPTSRNLTQGHASVKPTSSKTIPGADTIDVALWDEHFNRSDLAFASATIAGFSDDLGEADQAVLVDRSRAAIDEALADYPTVTAENRVEFRQSQQTRLNSFLIVITLLLGLALVIALVGIANTLALSVFERTREIGLLRAVGMTRRQLRRSIRWEAAIVAVFGALLGVAVGVVFGVAATLALPDAFVSDVQIPWVTLAVYVAVSAAAGLVAAILPARRAGRMNVLDAIAYE